MRSTAPTVAPRHLGALLAIALGALGGLVACGPTYPNCNSDEDCNKDKPRHEYCVNQTCQQCRADRDCGHGRQCAKGKCEDIANFCDSDDQCATGYCQGNRCRACTTDTQCGPGGRCKPGGKCLHKGQCDKDDDCGENEDCKGGICVAAVKPPPPPPTECRLGPIYFDFNEFVLSTEATEMIDKNAQCIKQVGRPVRLVGRTDPRGTEEYNLALSEKRAQQVKDRLGMLGLDGSKLHTLPKGELEATGKDEAGWAQDRRVDFEWM